jgi:hypothetical protein
MDYQIDLVSEKEERRAVSTFASASETTRR